MGYRVSVFVMWRVSYAEIGLLVFVFTTIEPFMKPILQSATGGLHSVSAEVIDKHDQYEVFNDPRAVRLLNLRSC